MKDVKSQELDLSNDVEKNHKQQELDMLEQSESSIKSIKTLLLNIMTSGKESETKSLLTKIIMAWYDLHWIFKGIISVLILAAIVVPAVLLQLWPIYIISALASIFYIGTMVLFYLHGKNETKNKNTDYMADVKRAYDLTCVIESVFTVLKGIAIDLRSNVDKFAIQNDLLENDVKRLGNCNETFEANLDDLSENVHALDSQVTDISDTALKFKMTVEKNETLVEKYRQHLETTQDNHQKESETMQHQIQALGLIKDKLAIQVEFATKQVDILKNAVGSLVNIQKENEEHLVSFQEKLFNLLEREEKNLERFAVRFEELGNKFQQQITVIEECNKKYKKIIEHKEAQISEKMPEIQTSSSLTRYGLYGAGCREEKSALIITPVQLSCC